MSTATELKNYTRDLDEIELCLDSYQLSLIDLITANNNTRKYAENLERLRSGCNNIMGKLGEMRVNFVENGLNWDNPLNDNLLFVRNRILKATEMAKSIIQTTQPLVEANQQAYKNMSGNNVSNQLRNNRGNDSEGDVLSEDEVEIDDSHDNYTKINAINMNSGLQNHGLNPHASEFNSNWIAQYSQISNSNNSSSINNSMNSSPSSIKSNLNTAQRSNSNLNSNASFDPHTAFTDPRLFVDNNASLYPEQVRKLIELGVGTDALLCERLLRNTKGNGDRAAQFILENVST